LITDTPSVSEVFRVVARYPLGVHASQNLLHDTPWVCTSTGIHDTLRVCINHKLRGLAAKCTCHTPHSAHTRTVYTCTRIKAELYVITYIMFARPLLWPGRGTVPKLPNYFEKIYIKNLNQTSLERKKDDSPYKVPLYGESLFSTSIRTTL
jgi:hypothetical protein